MKKYYCWRCKQIVPMLDEIEWNHIEPFLSKQIEIIQEYRKINKCDLITAKKESQKYAIHEYYQMTGFIIDNYEEIYKHRLINWGIECPQCGYLLRSPQAKYCVNCGYRN